jgi:hypothetical protein
MNAIRCLLICGLLTLLAAASAASNIYYWTDENGVRHFSNAGIPEGVDDLEEAPEQVTVTPPPVVTEDADATGEGADTTDPGSGSQDDLSPGLDEQTLKARERRYEDARQTWNQRISNERDQLESQIEAIENRSPSRFFTEGMREAQLEPLKTRLNRLNEDPEGYLNQKAPVPGDFGLPEGETPQ